LRSLQEIQPDFEEEAKAYAGLWSQGKKEKFHYHVRRSPPLEFIVNQTNPFHILIPYSLRSILVLFPSGVSTKMLCSFNSAMRDMCLVFLIFGLNTLIISDEQYNL
jgi:hypothetical protein